MRLLIAELPKVSGWGVSFRIYFPGRLGEVWDEKRESGVDTIVDTDIRSRVEGFQLSDRRVSAQRKLIHTVR